MLDSTGPLSGATPNGFTIALSKGTFNETIEISKRQHVVGACARETILNGASTSVSQIVDITGSGESSVRDITITGSSVGDLGLECGLDGHHRWCQYRRGNQRWTPG